LVKGEKKGHDRDLQEKRMIRHKNKKEKRERPSRREKEDAISCHDLSGGGEEIRQGKRGEGNARSQTLGKEERTWEGKYWPGKEPPPKKIPGKKKKKVWGRVKKNPTYVSKGKLEGCKRKICCNARRRKALFVLRKEKGKKEKIRKERGGIATSGSL